MTKGEGVFACLLSLMQLLEVFVEQPHPLVENGALKCQKEVLLFRRAQIRSAIFVE